MELFLLIACGIFAAYSLYHWLMSRTLKERLDEQISIGQLNVGLTTAEKDIATVCVYRLPNFVGSRNELYLRCDNAPIAELKNGTYVLCRVKPGPHVFSAPPMTGSVSLTLEPGQKAFIRTKVAPTQPVFEAVSEAQAQSEVNKLKQVS